MDLCLPGWVELILTGSLSDHDADNQDMNGALTHVKRSTACSMQDERMQTMMEDLRAKFKAVAAMLGVLDDYFPTQKQSASLDF